mmetsp:Transcript_17940/g.32897  ORF Transcript_17940/g.32897 Transcript_17940/m.32897 type:complete len:97 (+) Transcript_17940:970-1260(+)
MQALKGKGNGGHRRRLRRPGRWKFNWKALLSPRDLSGELGRYIKALMAQVTDKSINFEIEIVFRFNGVGSGEPVNTIIAFGYSGVNTQVQFCTSTA